MALSNEGVISILALVLAVVSILCTFYIEKCRQRERREDIGYGIEKDYEDIDGSGLLESSRSVRGPSTGKTSSKSNLPS